MGLSAVVSGFGGGHRVVPRGTAGCQSYRVKSFFQLKTFETTDETIEFIEAPRAAAASTSTHGTAKQSRRAARASPSRAVEREPRRAQKEDYVVTGNEA